MTDYATLAAAVWDLAQRGQSRQLVVANPEICQQFHAAQCHRNAARWVDAHPEHRAVGGWLVTGSCVFVLHSVVDTGTELLDITPRLGTGDDRLREFIVWPHPIEGLPSQLVWAG